MPQNGTHTRSIVMSCITPVSLIRSFHRKIMDSGELDFYQHTKVCSNTCRSTKIDLVGTKVSISSDQSAELVPAAASSADCKLLHFHPFRARTQRSVTGHVTGWIPMPVLEMRLGCIQFLTTLNLSQIIPQYTVLLKGWGLQATVACLF